MSDATFQPPDEPSYDGPWTIRNMPGPDRDAAVAAARRAGVTVATWLAEAIRAHVAREREPVGDVVAPGALVPHVGMPALSLEDLARAVEIAARIREIRGREPRRLLAAVTRRLEERLSLSRPQA
jgi:hypothetical protein